MNPNLRLALAAAGVFVVFVSANMVAESLYTRTKIGTDTKMFIGGVVVGIGAVYGVAKLMKIKA